MSEVKRSRTLKLILDEDALNKYWRRCYKKKHPKARVKPIEKPKHPSINEWMIKGRISMNQLKQKWKEFVVWWIYELHLENKNLANYEMIFTVFNKTKQRIDPDNTVPKFILDGFVAAGLLVDDDGSHMKSLTLKTGYDKKYPRTEIEIIYYEEEKEDE